MKQKDILKSENVSHTFVKKTDTLHKANLKI